MEIPESLPARAPRLVDTSAGPGRRRPLAGADVAPADSIEVSPEARSLTDVDDLTRARRIAQLRGQVDAGAYAVDPAALARLLAERGEA